MSRKTTRTSGKRCRFANTTTGRDKLPPDPEGENDRRAAFAQEAVNALRKATFVDRKDAVADLLANLMHLCDRDRQLGGFYSALISAETHYDAETAGEAGYSRT